MRLLRKPKSAILWLMAIDTPANLAILGAGPVGLEAALYARFLGYAVVIYERGHVAQGILDAHDTPLPYPFRDCHSPLGLAAVQAQDENFQTPARDAVLTHQQWRDCYLIPLANSDLLGDCLQLQTTVLQVELLPWDAHPPAVPDYEADDIEEAVSPPTLRVTVQRAGEPIVHEDFAAVLDCTGRAANPTWQAIENAAAPSTPSSSFSQPTPNLYVLGSKTASHPDFPLTSACSQIRDVFRIIGDRAALDLYASSARLLQ